MISASGARSSRRLGMQRSFFRKAAKSFCRNFIRRGKIQKTDEKNTLKGQEKTLLTTDDHPGTLKVLRCQEDEERKNQKH